MTVGALALAASCGGSTGYGSPTSPGTNGTGSTSNSVSVRDNSFSPSATTVPMGTSVTWTWSGSNQHNVTFDDGPASQTQTTGTYARTFASAGTYRYHCTIHGTIMSGTVTVQ